MCEKFWTLPRNVQNHHGRHGRCRRKGNRRRTSQAHRQRGEGSTESCFKDSIRQVGADVAACPHLPAGLREPDALGGLSYRHRQGYAFGGGSAHALRLAYLRAVSRGGCVLRRSGRKGVCRGKKKVVEKRDNGFWIYNGWRNALHKINMLTASLLLIYRMIN